MQRIVPAIIPAPEQIVRKSHKRDRFSAQFEVLMTTIIKIGPQFSSFLIAQSQFQKPSQSARAKCFRFRSKPLEVDIAISSHLAMKCAGLLAGWLLSLYGR
jgi:hypothetical protein